MISRLINPYFLWRPAQFLRALKAKFIPSKSPFIKVQLPWGSTISAPANDFSGHYLCRHGIVAIEACEAVFQLLEEGETGVDAGANFGTVTCAMARKAGQTGQVFSFEMVPETYQGLLNNAAKWQNHCPNIRLHNLPLSDANMEVRIGLSPDFKQNRGIAYVAKAEVQDGHEHLSANARTLDSFFPPPAQIHFLKVDVERHEEQVFRGALSLLSSGRIRDIIFEDVRDAHSPAKDLLISYGYSLFTTVPGMQGISLSPFVASGKPYDPDDYTDFIATKEPHRLQSRWNSKRYLSLRG